MAEAVGLASGLLALTVFAFKSGTKLYATIDSFQSRPRKVRELLMELAALNTVLQRLSVTTGIDGDVDLSALKATLKQCRRACDDFEGELKRSAQSEGDRASLRDWARFTYKGSDSIEAFKQQLIGYKATITVALSFANLRTSAISVEAIQSCRSLIETTTIDLEDYLADIQQKLATLVARENIGGTPDPAIVKRIEDERLSTEKGLQLCLQLSEHIDQIQSSFVADGGRTPHLFDPNPTSQMLVGEGLEGCKDYINFALERLKKHRQKVADRLGSDPTGAISSDDKLLLDKLQGEADTLQHCLKFCSNVDSYLEEQISHIENDAQGDDSIQIMVSTDGTPFNGKNKGVGRRVKQAGGHFDNASLQKVSADFTTISIHQKEIKEPTNEHSPVLAPEAATGSSEGPFSGPGFTLAPKSGFPTGALGNEARYGSEPAGGENDAVVAPTPASPIHHFTRSSGPLNNSDTVAAPDVAAPRVLPGPAKKRRTNPPTPAAPTRRVARISTPLNPSEAVQVVEAKETTEAPKKATRIRLPLALRRRQPVAPTLEGAFPNGHTRMNTSGAGFLCGFRALILSMGAQHPRRIAPPTMFELDGIFRSPTLAATNAEFGLANRNNFTIDQLAAVIGLWGADRGLNIQLAVELDGAEPFVVPAPAHPGLPVVLWIHNDNAVGLGIAPVAHYSGIEPIPAPVGDGIEVLFSEGPDFEEDEVGRNDELPLLDDDSLFEPLRRMEIADSEDPISDIDMDFMHAGAPRTEVRDSEDFISDLDMDGHRLCQGSGEDAASGGDIRIPDDDPTLGDEDRAESSDDEVAVPNGFVLASDGGSEFEPSDQSIQAGSESDKDSSFEEELVEVEEPGSEFDDGSEFDSDSMCEDDSTSDEESLFDEDNRSRASSVVDADSYPDAEEVEPEKLRAVTPRVRKIIQELPKIAEFCKTFDTTNLQISLGISAAEAGQYLAEAGELGPPPLPADYVPDEKYVALIAAAITAILDDDTLEMGIAIRLVLSASRIEDWARAIDACTPKAVKAFVLRDEPPEAEEFRQLPAVTTEDFGVYACQLLARKWDLHNHLYVGSATSAPSTSRPGGILGRKGDRLLKPTAARRRSLFYNLLWDGKPREAVWITLLHIPGSQATEDTNLRTRFRILALLGEAIFHNLLASWRSEARSQLSRWAHADHPVDWWGLNTVSPFYNGVVVSLSASMKRARRRERRRERIRDMTPDTRTAYYARQVLRQKKHYATRLQRAGNSPGKLDKLNRYERERKANLKAVQRGTNGPVPNRMFRPEEEEFVVDLRESNPDYTWRQICQHFNERFPRRDEISIKKHYTRYLKDGIPSQHWLYSKKEDDLILELRARIPRLTWKQVHKEFEKQFPGRRTQTGVSRRWHAIYKGPRIAPPEYSAEEDTLLIALKTGDDGFSWEEIRERFNEKFPTNRTQRSLERRYYEVLQKRDCK
ncbi:uncharacterized protein DNG_07361 [Cephalotrichum gorgonifer]|uniref:Myb-like domain-containing protein n=1 Tax=Cephalotrichum gorgonifer TaxID=2041049 RepID=A0AAE8N1H1_9PEZI|nr:uncharacterized protein DNG_07361 [Cephalotrichum gorgonifer]